MHPKLFIPLLLLLSACGGRERSVPGPVVGVSKTDTRLYSKRAPENLLEQLYDDTVSRSVALTQLEQKLRAMSGEKSDSLEVYEAYKRYNQEYYQTATGYAAQVKDSVLRQRLQQLLESSRSAQGERMAAHDALDSAIDRRQRSIGELRVAVKVLLTLPLMERYQRMQLPPKAPLEALDRNWQQLERQLDTLRRKNGG